MKCKKNNIIKTLSAVLTASALLLTGCSGAKSSTQTDQDLTYTDMLFDTVIKIQILDPADESILDGLKKLCEKYDTMFSATNTDSELYKLNHANGQPFTVSSETANLIQEGIHYSELSGGAFDLTIEPVSALWDFKADKPTVPSSDAIAQAVSHVDYTKVDIQDNTVTLEDPEAGIDLGAIAKGYIADQVKTYLKKQGIKHAIINLGGNVDVIGTKPDGSKYNIGIQKPFDESGEAITSVQLKDQTVVTSGIYERYFKKNGKLYHHILDPRTGYPCENNLYSVSIITDSSTKADALSTTCFLLGYEKGMELIQSMDGVKAIFITDDEKVHKIGI
ncbi:FAD:protein FMN transferase [Dorea longicatena]|jgi:thiamine biosynthesis lipoprotein|uniref:FAD:protein FMN transferase n=1 Tax=Dorea longicatena TaxID=88431 RepID=UPI001D009A2D|nr:FAD:protein FMN transferase [Dorea longicatena]MCB5536352.1 FAD:protein FMN transferase [bacterium MSK17_88]MCB5548039.1 FAD:protein FMN transferase [Dorea longicatena]MCG4574730.1 FAD:protein FMN transferase [Dorea longicatena]